MSSGNHTGKVSNPHRYGQNDPIRGVHPGHTEFQTLIGTVKTPGQVEERSLVVLFQTLIGTVKTVEKLRTITLLYEVSNPHRYGQNLEVGQYNTGTANGFKPS
ncbi:hypothetical protein TTMY_0124 [Thermus thermophilus]|nr:hypothetical protein TTMY_0124 [Thermus thermophilus]